MMRTFWLLPLLWSDASTMIGASTSIIPDGCSCENGGTCRTDSPFCACKIGWTGATCDKPYESCSDKCQNGGKCLDGALDDFGNMQNYCSCDRYHTGNYCQHAVIPIDVECTESNKAQFCLNGGACNPGYYPNSKTSPCLCPSPYTGDRCQDVIQIHTADSTTSPEELIRPETTNAASGFIASEASGTDPTCTLDCQRGQCKFGQLISHPDGWESPSLTMHCSCEIGYGGPYCEHTAAACGSHNCYNGGSCVKDDSTGLLHCDCDTATSDQVYYAGQFCQYDSTDYCMFHPEVGHLFCVNDGKCRMDALHEGCDCPSGYEGFACEFKVSSSSSSTTTSTNNEDDYSVCELPCTNGGVCRKGSQYLDTNNGSSAVVVEHCVCPLMFSGELCENESASDGQQPQTLSMNTDTNTIDCGTGRHTCPNSAKCIAFGDELLCDCNTPEAANLATFYEGQNCVHPTHDICTIGVSASDAASFHQVVPTQQLSYCVNGGRCKSAVKDGEPHPGCNCADGFLGPHCELRESSPIPRVTYRKDDSENFNENVANQNVFRVGIAIVMVLVMSVFVVMLVHTARRRRKQRFGNEVTSSLFWSSGYSDVPANSNNLAPKRSSSLFAENTKDVYTDAVQQSSRRDMAIEMSNRARKTAASINDDDDDTTTANNNKNDRPKAAPKLYIGPPRDEDGHELHNVEIV